MTTRAQRKNSKRTKRRQRAWLEANGNPRWCTELEHWVCRRGHECTVRATSHETGLLVVDGKNFRWRVVWNQYYSTVALDGDGAKHEVMCDEQKMRYFYDAHNCDGVELSPRHPGLRWWHAVHNRWIDADEMMRAWRESILFPWELPCQDAEGRCLTLSTYFSNGVDANSMLEGLEKCGVIRR